MATLQKDIISKIVFSYKKRSVSLTFELQDDIEYLKDFRNLLIEARKDLDKLIEKGGEK